MDDEIQRWMITRAVQSMRVALETIDTLDERLRSAQTEEEKADLAAGRRTMEELVSRCREKIASAGGFAPSIHDTPPTDRRH